MDRFEFGVPGVSPKTQVPNIKPARPAGGNPIIKPTEFPFIVEVEWFLGDSSSLPPKVFGFASLGMTMGLAGGALVRLLNF